MSLLPTQKRKPTVSLAQKIILLYAKPKAGKSTFASQAPDNLFLATEPGLSNLEVYEVPCPDYPTFSRACAELAAAKEQGECPFRTVTVDTVDNLYKMVQDYICKQQEIDHPTDLEWGKGSGMVNNEFERVLRRLSMLPNTGLILISHEKDKTFKRKGGGEYSKIVPSVPGGGLDIVYKLADIILYVDQEQVTGEDGKVDLVTVMRTKPHHDYIAGDRTRRLPPVLPLNYDILREAYEGPEGDRREAAWKALEEQRKAKALAALAKDAQTLKKAAAPPNGKKTGASA